MSDEKLTAAELTLLGKKSHQVFGVYIGKEYYNFESPTGLCGLCKCTKERIDLVAVYASQKGQGQCRDFIAQAKKNWKEIRVLEIWNYDLADALNRYGFKKFEENGEVGMKWSAS